MKFTLCCCLPVRLPLPSISLQWICKFMNFMKSVQNFSNKRNATWMWWCKPNEWIKKKKVQVKENFVSRSSNSFRWNYIFSWLPALFSTMASFIKNFIPFRICSFNFVYCVLCSMQSLYYCIIRNLCIFILHSDISYVWYCVKRWARQILTINGHATTPCETNSNFDFWLKMQKEPNALWFYLLASDIVVSTVSECLVDQKLFEPDSFPHVPSHPIPI